MNASDDDEKKIVVRRYIEQVVNTGDLSRIGDFISSDYAEEGDETGESSGIEGAKRHVLGVRSTYPDLQVTVGQQIAEGDWVASRVTARGTHLGKWMEMKPTGKQVEISGINWDKVVDGKIVQHGGAANLLFPLMQIGAVRVVDSDNG